MHGKTSIKQRSNPPEPRPLRGDEIAQLFTLDWRPFNRIDWVGNAGCEGEPYIAYDAEDTEWIMDTGPWGTHVQRSFTDASFAYATLDGLLPSFARTPRTFNNEVGSVRWFEQLLSFVPVPAPGSHLPRG